MNTFENQKITKVKFYTEEGTEYRITVKLRFDDDCKNGHNTFAITGDIDRKDRFGRWTEDSGGCIHSDIAKRFPELRHLIKWHLVSDDGPLHYIANALYHASDRDCWGLLKGEKRQIKNGKTGLPAWHLVAIDKTTGDEVELYSLGKSIDSADKPECNYTLEFRPWCRIGEGKAVDLEAARSVAIWPDARLEDFTAERLTARLPGLMQEFYKDISAIGLKTKPDHQGTRA